MGRWRGQPRSWLGSLFTIALAVGGGPGCEALVSDSLPSDIACTGDMPGICPSGEACVNGRCGPPPSCPGAGCIVFPDAGHSSTTLRPADGGVDAHVDARGHDAHDAHDGTKPVDAGHDTAPPLVGLGELCDITASNCKQGFCVDSQDLSGLGLPPGYLCSEICCTDADCSDGGVCYPTTGGNFCITAAAAKNCSPALCGASCCDDSQCTDGTFCAVGAGSVPSCQKPSPGTSCETDIYCDGTPGGDCYQNSDCNNGVCAPTNASDTSCDSALCVCFGQTDCCKPSDCTKSGDTCEWIESPTGEVFRGCQKAGGHVANGTMCSGSECAGGICATFPSGTLCTQPCCQDADCPPVNGAAWTCAPLAVPLNTAGNTTILLCQPPVERPL